MHLNVHHITTFKSAVHACSTLHTHLVKVEVKVKVTSEQASMPQRGSKARATLETGCPHTVLSQEQGQGETPHGKTVLS